MKELAVKGNPAGKTGARSPARGGGKYIIYAFVAAPSGDRGGIGVDGERVFAISRGKVAAVVSATTAKRLRPERRHLEAHNRVIRQLLADGTVLPLAFGAAAGSQQSVQRILERNAEELAAQLDRLAQKIEMGLRVVWDVPNIFDYFVQTHPELRAARDRLLGQRRTPAQDDKIEVGRMFDRILNEDREKYSDMVENELSGTCLDFKRNRCRNEQELTNLACLIRRDNQPAFEAAVLRAAQLFDNSFAFDYNGPWAPYSFVSLSLSV